jgi:hypothetical protein
MTSSLVCTIVAAQNQLVLTDVNKRVATKRGPIGACLPHVAV